MRQAPALDARVTDGGTTAPLVPSRRVRLAFAAAAASALTLLVLQTTGAAYLAQVSPRSALAISPGSAAAHLLVAEAHLAAMRAEQPDVNDGERASRAAAAEASARAALLQRPLSAQGFRLLAEMAEFNGARESADRLVAAATALNQHEYAALLLSAQRSWESNDVLRALDASDAVLRTRPDLAAPVFIAMAGLAETPAGRTIIKQRLLEKPPWRDHFLTAMLPGVRDAAMPLDLMLHLRSAGQTLPRSVVNGYVAWLISHRLYSFAHAAWMQLLDRERLMKVGFVFNGDFEFAPAGSPFDWNIQRGRGVAIEIASLPGAEDNRALKIELGNSRVLFGEVHQRLALAPGNYVLTGRYVGEFTGRRGLQWRLSCADRGETQLVQTQMITGQFKAWREFSLPVTIPSQGCASQFLRLVHDARHSAEQFASGLIWFDDLRLSRAPRAAAAEQAGEKSSVDRPAVPP